MAASIEHELKAFEYTPDGDLLEQSLDSSFLSHMRSMLLDDFVSILDRYAIYLAYVYRCGVFLWPVLAAFCL